jgi:hypothetical protein
MECLFTVAPVLLMQAVVKEISDLAQPDYLQSLAVAKPQTAQ